ncbi:MAG: hypothetical protein NTW36_04825 [Planctomycetia bacterium]|nr:hypothetical protein [Planctomycetia bacterium]
MLTITRCRNRTVPAPVTVVVPLENTEEWLAKAVFRVTVRVLPDCTLIVPLFMVNPPPGASVTSAPAFDMSMPRPLIVRLLLVKVLDALVISRFEEMFPTTIPFRLNAELANVACVPDA